MKRRIAIIGGGLAGIAAAVRLAEHEYAPIVIETTKRLGGRATSYVDPKTGRVYDNCQHVALGCCTNLIDLYERLRVSDRIEWHRTMWWTDGNGVRRLAPGWLPAPLQFMGALRRCGLFDRTERRAIHRGMRRIAMVGDVGAIAWSGRTFADFLRAADQPESVVRRFWDTVIVSACNLDCERVAAEHALKVFRDAFLGDTFASAIGISDVPLVDLYEPAAGHIAEAGGEVLLGRSARSLTFDGERITGVVTDEGMIEASAVIAALPPDRLSRLASDALQDADARFAEFEAIPNSPILGVHLVFERSVMEQPHLTCVDMGVQWLFNKGVDELGGHHVHAVISAADDWMDLDEATIVERVCRDLERVLPAARGLAPLDARAIREKRATFAATPEVERMRPPTVARFAGVGGRGVTNLFLAGDWTDTGWPATMEGAVRSGYAAAGAIVGERCVVEDLPAPMLTRVLARIGRRFKLDPPE